MDGGERELLYAVLKAESIGQRAEGLSGYGFFYDSIANNQGKVRSKNFLAQRCITEVQV